MKRYTVILTYIQDVEIDEELEQEKVIEVAIENLKPYAPVGVEVEEE